MKRDGRQVELQQSHVLHDEGVDAGVPAVVGYLSGTFLLMLIEQGVQRHIDPGVVQSRMTAQAFDVTDAVGGLLTCAEVGAADIDGIGTVVDGSHAHLGIFGGRKEFYLLRIHAAKLRFFGTMTIIFVFLQV